MISEGLWRLASARSTRRSTTFNARGGSTTARGLRREAPLEAMLILQSVPPVSHQALTSPYQIKPSTAPMMIATGGLTLKE